MLRVRGQQDCKAVLMSANPLRDEGITERTRIAKVKKDDDDVATSLDLDSRTYEFWF